MYSAAEMGKSAENTRIQLIIVFAAKTKMIHFKGKKLRF